MLKSELRPRPLPMLASCAALAALLLALPASSNGQIADWEKMKAIAPRSYVCSPATSSPTVDGKLDEAAWLAAPWTDDFVDIEGVARPVPRFRTRAKMLWDSEYFYVAAELSEPHVWGTLTAHDAVIFHDNDFEVFLDPDGDNHKYYELELNALNTTWDLFLPRPYKDGGGADNGWEIPGLKSAIHVSGTLNQSSDVDTGWSVEIAIPWKSLNRSGKTQSAPKNGDQWRVDFSRVEWQHELVDGQYRKVAGTREDNWVWSPPGIIDMHRPERWGIVQFSTDPPGTAVYVPDASLTDRDLLMEIYHRQKSFHKQHGRWASALTELGVNSDNTNRLREADLRLTDDGYQATLVTPIAGQAVRKLHVRQDSRLWTTSADEVLEAALTRAGENRAQIQLALTESPGNHREAMEFLVEHMPDRDLQSLTGEFLLENVRLAYEAIDAAPWKHDIPKDIFFNEVLPYASINERRDNWRSEFREKFLPLIRDARTPSDAAALLNQKVFPLVNVRYSTQRRKADQSPIESIKSGLASCTGLSVLLIDACRSLGVPARFVGTPLWADNSGNHSWIEVWDNGWHFTGAAEPNGMELDKAWFVDRASTARHDEPRHAIYAVSYRRTPLTFPLVWDRTIDYVWAVNVTDRYVNRGTKPPAGTVRTMFCILDQPGGRRQAAQVRVTDKSGATVFEGVTRDERDDANNHLTADLPADQEFEITIAVGESVATHSFRAVARETPLVWFAAPMGEPKPDPAAAALADEPSAAALQALTAYFDGPTASRPPIDSQPFAEVALTKSDAGKAAELLKADHRQRILAERAAEMEAKVLVAGDLKMPFDVRIFGEKPVTGRSLYISMHGGGGAPARVNDQQWQNQKRLYQLEEGVYVAPRAPTDTWDLWHQGHIDGLFDRLVENLVVFEDVNPDRVYIMGYSAGGDGVYQLAPRMADRWAAAAMMAGHPNETSPLGLRNLPFTLHMGGLDSAYNRNKVAAEWEVKLAELQRADPGGYVHLVRIHPDKKHWMDREDAEAIPWMAKFNRNRLPDRIVWKQDDVVASRFYWLRVNPTEIPNRAEVIAEHHGQKVLIQSADVRQLTIRLNDEMADLDQPVTITSGNQTLFQGSVDRTVKTLAATLAERGDPLGLFSAEITVELPAPPSP